MSEEKRYTLEQARRLLNRQVCAQHGHDLEHILKGDGDLSAVYCSRCGASWNTTRVGP